MTFQRSEPEERKVWLSFEGRPLQVSAGENLAAALLAAGIKSFRETPSGGAPRGPYCMMGICFECLLEVDARQNQQACMLPVREGMTVRRQKAVRRLPG
ncbi:MAG TPA: (2Fe-2S)-binding protein [Kiloniellales bacterium]|nr:(2Fe-2S)-binding protein [Kiloniellales bacterium]